MHIERHFLGWDAPALDLAVRYLWDHFATETDWDLSDLVIAVPGARAGRRLEELLVAKAEGQPVAGPVRLYSPPAVCTLGSLPERLHSSEEVIADALVSLAARVKVLREAEPGERACHFPHLERNAEPEAIWQIAGSLEALEAELAAENYTAEKVRDALSDRGLRTSAARWEWLRRLQGAYEHELKAHSRITKWQARRSLRAEPAEAQPVDVLLLSIVDLPRLTEDILVAFPGRVTALIHAPEALSEGFDAAGRLNASFWGERPVDLPESALHFVDSPQLATGLVPRLLDLYSGVAPADVTVGLGDEALGASVLRHLNHAQWPARQGNAGTLDQSSPAQFLRLLAGYRTEASVGAFSALLRHPAFTDWLGRHRASAEGNWLELVERADEVLQSQLPGRVELSNPKLAESPLLANALEALSGLPGAGEEPRRLHQWAAEIRACLRAVFGVPRPGDPSNLTPQALGEFEKLLARFEVPDGEEELLPEASFAETIGLIMLEAAKVPLAAPGTGKEVELVGWLECHLDDAPVLILTGFNEGQIPQRASSSPFLTDTLRRELALPDSARRYARDAYSLSAILASRLRVELIAARHDARGGWLTPSRLLFACDPTTTAERVLRFYGEAAPEPVTPLLTGGETYPLARFLAPAPPNPPLAKLNITAFKTYLQCPYRFYLRHVLELGDLRDETGEMAGDLFGNLAHAALQRFGQEEMARDKPDSDAASVFARLNAALDEAAHRQFGPAPIPTVRFQIQQLRRRLEALALVQMQAAAQGWRIQLVEQRVENEVWVDGEPFTLVGRIDRIDRHPDLGFRVVDYKTSGAGDSPEKTHRRGRKNEKTWVDLQLPLYRRLLPKLRIDPKCIELSYLLLCEDLDKINFAPAKWTDAELETADAEADRVIRAVRASVFWPPAEQLPAYPDGLEGLCRDALSGRAALIRQGGVPGLKWTKRPRPRTVLVAGGRS